MGFNITIASLAGTSFSRGSHADREIIRGDGEGKGERDTSRLSTLIIRNMCVISLT